MTENKKFESKRYLYREADVYTPHSFRKPKLHEMGYFTNNMKAFENQKVRIVKDSYVYGELIDYNDDCERRYRSNTKWCDPYGVYDYSTFQKVVYRKKNKNGTESIDIIHQLIKVVFVLWWIWRKLFLVMWRIYRWKNIHMCMGMNNERN